MWPFKKEPEPVKEEKPKSLGGCGICGREVDCCNQQGFIFITGWSASEYACKGCHKPIKPVPFKRYPNCSKCKSGKNIDKFFHKNGHYINRVHLDTSYIVGGMNGPKYDWKSGSCQKMFNDKEHLHRVCQDCGYEWIMEVAS